jgi:hypothetical protein
MARALMDLSIWGGFFSKIWRVLDVSQRFSGYQRQERDSYETPAWVTEALCPHLPPLETIWEPACGSGSMVRVLESWGVKVIATDIAAGQDFLVAAPQGVGAIVTNPPYALAQRFIEHALQLTTGIVAMLLRCDFDHAKTRQHLFSGCPAFAKKLILTRRIVWFEGPKAAPSFNHAWYLWDGKHRGPPILAYGP